MPVLAGAGVITLTTGLLLPYTVEIGVMGVEVMGATVGYPPDEEAVVRVTVSLAEPVVRETVSEEPVVRDTVSV